MLHPTIAEQVLYTLGGNSNLALSRKHFTQAVNLNPKSTRALYGLLMVSRGSSFELPAYAHAQLHYMRLVLKASS